MAIIDHKEIYKNRLLQQYKTSVNLIGLIDALIEGQGDLELVLDQLLTERAIETAVGTQLDIIGEIVGQPRVILDVSGLEFFGYQTDGGPPPPLVDGYGSLSDTTVGARYRSLDEQTGSFRTLGDTEYRYFIKGKIFKNVGSIDTENLLDAFRFIFGDSVVVVLNELGNHAVGITVVSQIPETTSQLLIDNDVLPRPAGVLYNISFTTGDGNQFAFFSFPGGSTFGTITNPTIGGEFNSV